MNAPSKPTLPIDAVLPALCEALSAHNRALLVAHPGAGKTTRAPLALLEANPASRGRWLLLEPRRVAARLAAAHMAELLGEPVGQTVGYRVRGEQKVSRATRLEVVTQGIFTRVIQEDPLLEGIAGVIFDEFHERSLDADFGLALALDVQTGLREDLSLLVMSATLDVEALRAVLGAATPVVDCPGRAWPVATSHRAHSPREPAEVHRARVVREALAQHEGNLLVFLPGQAEIRRLETILREQLAADVDLQPLHGALPLGRQQSVLGPAPDGRRRVILSTAIAESSLTVGGVRVVVDAGLERVPVYQPRTGLTRLATRQVNRASADQRRGRAGRDAPGYCYRLWSSEQVLRAHGEPEILQGDLAGLAFELARWGVKDPLQLSWVTPPPAAAMSAARAMLQTLGILDPMLQLTDFGRGCARWPTHPRLAALLETAAALGALPLACWTVAWLEEGIHETEVDLTKVLERRPRRDSGGAGGADGRWWRSARQWLRLAGCAMDAGDLAPLPTLLAHAFPDRIARQVETGRFKLASGGHAVLRQDQPLAHVDWLVAIELDGQAAGARTFRAAAITLAELEAAFPATRTWHARVEWNEAAGRLAGEEVRILGELVIERRPLPRLAPETVRRALLDAVRRRGGLAWSADDVQLLGRLRLVRRVLNDPWPDLSEAHLLETLEDWLAPWLDGITRLDQLDKLPLGQYLQNRLDWSLRRRLDELAPTHLEVPSGSRLRIDYAGDDPVLAVKLQEMFGQTETPRLVNGRVPVVVHLLSPARRPVQITRDLASFWATTYFDVRRDLKGRYPKHPWPDDPLTAQATARYNRRPDGR